MKYIKFLSLGLMVWLLSSCSKDVMDRLNRDHNNPTDVTPETILPSAIVETAFGSTGTDLAWYASLYTEQSAGVDEQFYDGDRRSVLSASSLVNNNWNSIYDNLSLMKDLMSKTAPNGENPNPALTGVTEVLTAYNLAIATDMWGDIPWSQAIQGSENLNPAFDTQEDIYTDIQQMLDDAVSNLTGNSGSAFSAQDLIYSGNSEKWIKAAWSLKARYYMHIEKRDPSVYDKVLDCASKGFTSADDAFIFDKYENTQIGANPWFDFTYLDRGDLCVGQTLYDLMNDREDPRIHAYFLDPDGGDGSIVPAPNGTASRTRAGSGTYSYSKITAESQANATVATPMMTYHELLFLEAEATARKGLDFKPLLKQALEANFTFHGLAAGDADTYYTAEVEPRLGGSAEEELDEIMTQKYIAMYEQESIEVYNDVRRTGVPVMNNPNNNLANFGFPQRFPYGTSEVTANSANVPSVNIFHDKIWWAQ